MTTSTTVRCEPSRRAQRQAAGVGPVEDLVIGFPGDRFKGEIVEQALADLATD
jgi:hypothetical protein